jgi:tight adherence protein B
VTSAAVFSGALVAVAAGLLPHRTPSRRLAAIAGVDQRAAAPGRYSGRRRIVASAAVALGVLWSLVGTTPTLLIMAAVAAGMVVVRRGQARRHERKLRLVVCEFCRSVAAELRSGAIAGEALRRAVAAAPPPLGGVLQPLAEVASTGDVDEVADALSTAACTAPGLDGLRLLAACWRVVIAAGAMTAPAIDRVADALGDELELDLELASALAGPRASWRLLAALPVAGVLLGVALGADPLGFLLGSPVGFACLGGGAVLDAVGLVWVRRIVSRPVRAG